jgi:TonB family protein
MRDFNCSSLIRFVSSALITAACSAPPPPAAPTDASQAPAPADAAREPTEPPATAAPPALAPTAQPQASESPGPADTRGKEDIQRVVAENRDKVRACYDAALSTNPGIKGDLVISFVIDPEGNVKAAETNWSESDLHVPELDTCAVEAVKTFKFPASSRGLESKVNYPFNFNPPPPGKPASKR